MILLFTFKTNSKLLTEANITYPSRRLPPLYRHSDLGMCRQNSHFIMSFTFFLNFLECVNVPLTLMTETVLLEKIDLFH